MITREAIESIPDQVAGVEAIPLTRYSPYWESSGSMGNLNEIVA